MAISFNIRNYRIFAIDESMQLYNSSTKISNFKKRKSCKQGSGLGTWFMKFVDLFWRSLFIIKLFSIIHFKEWWYCKSDLNCYVCNSPADTDREKILENDKTRYRSRLEFFSSTKWTKDLSSILEVIPNAEFMFFYAN